MTERSTLYMNETCSKAPGFKGLRFAKPWQARRFKRCPVFNGLRATGPPPPSPLFANRQRDLPLAWVCEELPRFAVYSPYWNHRLTDQAPQTEGSTKTGPGFAGPNFTGKTLIRNLLFEAP